MKLLVCDVEGTIFKANYRIKGTDFASTMWQPIAQRLGEMAIQEEKETHDKWESGDYNSYREWVLETIKIHKKYQLHVDDFKELVNSAVYNSGVEDFFQQLDRDKYIPVLVSGGFQELIRRAQIELNINHGTGACEYFFHKEDGILNNYSLKTSDFDGKYDHIKMLFSEYGLNAKEDWVFIGDGKNDKHIAKKAPLSIGINPHPELEVDYEITCFSEIMSILEKHDFKAKVKPRQKTINRNIEKRNKYSEISEEEKLRKENEKLRKRLDKLDSKKKRTLHKRELKEKVFDNMITAQKEDYVLTPAISLKSLLNECRIVFFGAQKEYSLFKYLESFHPNLKVIKGVDDKFDLTPVINADFVFTYNKCMSHSASWRAEVAKKTVPYCNLNHTNTEMLEKAMANILYRHFFQPHDD